MIQLTKPQIKIIRAIKGHDDYKINARDWFRSLIPLYTDIYGWDEVTLTFRDDIRALVFNSLLDIYMLIKDDNSDSNSQLKVLFNVAFQRTTTRDYDNPIDRVIAELCGLIQSNKVLGRYNIDL